MVLFSINSKEQVATIPLLNIKDNKIVCGTIPTVWAIPHWPLWFPFCESNKLLRRFSPSSFIMNCTLKVLFLRIDFVVLVDIADKLHTEEECLEILMRSPPAGSEGEEWMGITVPPKCGSLPRICIRESRLKMRPTASDQFQCDLQLEMDDPAQAPTWAKVFVFQQLGLRIIPEMCKFQPKIPGSPLDTYLNGSDKKDMEGEMIPPEGLEYIRQMDESIRKYHAGRSLKQGTSKSSGRSHSFSNSKKVLQDPTARARDDKRIDRSAKPTQQARSTNGTNGKEAHWFYLDEIVEHEKGSYPALDVFAFVELLAETKEVLRSLRHPDEWVELYRRWSDRRMSKGRAGAVIFDGRLESILMVQSFRGSFSFPAGKLEDDETEVECAIREVQEELGMDLSQLLNERFVISTPEKVQVKPSTKKEIQKIAWIHVTKLPGWTTSTTSSKLRFFNVEPFIPELKRWARRNAEATLDPATQTSTSLSREAGLSADWLDLERALSCFDAAWDGALKTRRSFEAEVNRVKVPGMIFLEQATCGRPQWWSTLASVPLGLNPLTNVLLKRIILQMTEIHAGRDRTRYMRKTTYAEFIVGIMVVIIAISVAACASSGVSILNPDFLRPVTVALTLAILVLVVLDGVFSWSAYTALRSVVRDVRMVMPAQEAGRLSTAMAVARANLCLVVLAVLGTSLFYGMFVVGGVAFLLFYQAGPVQQNEDYSDAPFALALVPLVIWCLDSIFNDVCAVYLGCGPTQAALELVTQASQVDAVGMPVADTVSGQVLGASVGSLPNAVDTETWRAHK
ncbi:unnamed protein product [Durusdinium trenchii]|uniref:Nudix hydrolase domain-containing protein n=1 Tax=Durusdinium trenchii TaxID=1381693 RepID=A0ABP0JNH7_9DINO